MSNSATITNKANIQPIPTDRYVITSSDVVKYLQNQLGFTFICDFTRWTGVSPDKSYVRMRAVFQPDDVIAKTTASGYVDSILAATASDLKFKSTVMDTLKPFMYPSTIGDIWNHPEDLKRLAEMGLVQERLMDLVANSKLNYCKDVNLFRLYLRPERIIADMLADPASNEVKGHMEIIGVYGTTSETIRWEVAVTNTKNSFNELSDINLDAIFDRR